MAKDKFSYSTGRKWDFKAGKANPKVSQEPAILEQNQFFLQGRKKLKKKSVKIEETSKQREHLVKHFTNFIH